MTDDAGPLPTSPSVTVLIALYNGAAHLEEQLASLKQQTLPVTEIIASDDGSSDDTRSVFNRFMADWPSCQFRLLDGPRKGYAANFHHLLCQEVTGDLVATSDQDDVWAADKLARAAEHLTPFRDCFALYGARTEVCDERLNQMRLSRLITPPFGLQHALVQSFAGGNTLVMNRITSASVRKVLARSGVFGTHDWFLYQWVCAIGGRIVYDDTPVLKYRQHADSLFGDSGNTGARRARLQMVKDGRYRTWVSQNLAVLEAGRDHLTEDACLLIDRFAQARCTSGWRAIRAVQRLGLRRQGRAGQAGLLWAAATGRL